MSKVIKIIMYQIIFSDENIVILSIKKMFWIDNY